MLISFLLRQGSTELDSSWPTERDNPVMLSAAKHLCAYRDRPFAAPSLCSGLRLTRVTRCDCSNGQGLFFTIEPCLTTSFIPARTESPSAPPHPPPPLVHLPAPVLPLLPRCVPMPMPRGRALVVPHRVMRRLARGWPGGRQYFPGRRKRCVAGRAA